MLRRKAILTTIFGVITIGLIGAGFTHADDGFKNDVFRKSRILFTQQDRVVTFNLTPPTSDQPFGGGIGAQVGTATGAINGTTVVNFKFTFTSNPAVRPLTFNFDNRVGITDIDGDQVIFKNVGTGRFNPNLLDPTVGGDPGNAPFQVFGAAATGGPLTGTYEVVARSGKYVRALDVGKVFHYAAISFNPASPPTPAGTTGSSYVEVYEK